MTYLPYNEGFYIFMIVFSNIAACTGFLQAYIMWTNRSVGSVSFVVWIISTISGILWLFWGLTVNDTVLIVSDIVGAIASGSVVGVYYYFYYNPDKTCENQNCPPEKPAITPSKWNKKRKEMKKFKRSKSASQMV